jgi:hypothetical protein
MTRIREVEIEHGKSPVDLQRVKKAYADLISDKTHPAPCTCPSCLYHLHKKKGGRFDKEIFFLDWLLLEVKLSLINQTERIVFYTPYGRGKDITSVEWRDFISARRIINPLARFVRDNFPDIDPSPRRIKLKLWRFRKSGVAAALEKEINLNGIKANPVDLKIIETWQALDLAQKVADHIYKQQDRVATQREIQRFIQKPVERFEEIRKWLEENYGIVRGNGKRKNQIIYTGTMKSSRGQILHVGVQETKKNSC